MYNQELDVCFICRASLTACVHRTICKNCGINSCEECFRIRIDDSFNNDRIEKVYTSLKWQAKAFGHCHCESQINIA